MRWVKNAVSQGVADENDKQLVIFDFDCDTVSDLPPQDLYSTSDNTIIAIGSTADVIDPKSKYKMKSDGTWVIQDVGNDYYSKAEIDDMIDDINDTDDMQDRALAELYGENANQQLEINYAINTGAKNVFSGSFTSQTLNGVAFTVNSDGTITANRTSTSSSAANLPSTNFVLKPGTYVFSCASNSQRDTTFDSYVYNVDTSTTIARDNPNDSPGNVFTITQDTTVRVNVRVASGYNAQNVVFSPMIRDSVITNNTFQPYAPTNRELYNAVSGKISMEDILSIGKNLSGTSTNHLDLLGTPDGQGGYTPGPATTPGVYNIGLTTLQNYCDNAPRTDAAAKLITMHLNSVNNVLLIFIPLVGSIPIYFRQIRYASQNFGSWYVLNPTQI